MDTRRVILAALLVIGAAGARAADAGPDAEARKLQARHDLQVRTDEAEVAAKQRDVENLQRAIDDADKRMAANDKKLEKAKADLDEVEGVQQKLADAKTAMQAADDRVVRETQQNHNTTTNGGGASPEAVQAQETTQKEWQRLKRLAAGAGSELPGCRQRVTALERDRKNEEKRKEENQQKLEAAKTALETSKQKLAELKATPAVPAAEEKPADKPADPKPGETPAGGGKDEGKVPAPAPGTQDKPKPDAPAP